MVAERDARARCAEALRGGGAWRRSPSASSSLRRRARRRPRQPRGACGCSAASRVRARRSPRSSAPARRAQSRRSSATRSRRGGTPRSRWRSPSRAETKIFRLTQAPVEPTEAGRPPTRWSSVEDVTPRPSGSSARCCSPSDSRPRDGSRRGVAHELNNPLATIAGCAESLRERLTERGLTTTSRAHRLPRTTSG